MMDRNTILSFLQNKKVLEIGPFLRPFISGEKVKYMDVLPVSGLKERATKVGYKWYRSTCPKEIHYVISDYDWSSVTDKFEAVFSSHCIEHQPNLVKHLQNVSSILEAGGSYFLCIPDKRYCIDHFKSVSTIGEILDYAEDKPLSFSQFFSSKMGVHNDPTRHWKGMHGEKFLSTKDIQDAMREFEKARKGYFDIHRWFFTPRSFYINLILLYQLGYTDLFPINVTDTKRNSPEFYARLTKMDKFELDVKFSIREYLSEDVDNVEGGSNSSSLSDAYWAHIYHDTIVGSKWLLDQSISPGGASSIAVGYNFLYVLYQILDKMHPRCILELGLGQSTCLTGQFAQRYGAKHFVVEHDKEWIQFFFHGRKYRNSRVFQTGLMETEFDGQKYHQYSNFNKIVESIASACELILIDGPIGSHSERSRRDLVPYIPKILSQEFAIVIGDCGRKGEENLFHEILDILKYHDISHAYGLYKSEGTKHVGVIVSKKWKIFTSM